MPDHLPFVIVVTRYDAVLNYKVGIWEQISTHVYEFAMRVVQDCIHLQDTRPEGLQLIDVTDNVIGLALKLKHRDSPLLANLRLRSALEGQWVETEVKELGPEGITPTEGRAQVVYMDLIDRR